MNIWGSYEKVKKGYNNYISVLSISLKTVARTLMICKKI